MILGLDVSTSIVGATLLDNDGKIVYCNAWDLRKYKDHFTKAEVVKNELCSTRFQPVTRIIIEKPVSSFFGTGGSSAKVITTLARFNGIISWICRERFGFNPEYIVSTTARKYCGVKVPRGTKAKEEVLKFVAESVDDFMIEYTKFGNPKPGSFDKADSYIVAKAGFLGYRET